ncbi:hypothetical protein A2U01_0111893, partial [Trifolium medium]|nr:hypothetical protein [Trifolium medium]
VLQQWLPSASKHHNDFYLLSLPALPFHNGYIFSTAEQLLPDSPRTLRNDHPILPPKCSPNKNFTSNP